MYARACAVVIDGMCRSQKRESIQLYLGCWPRINLLKTVRINSSSAGERNGREKKIR